MSNRTYRPGWGALRRRVFERDDRLCRKCALGDGLEVHHITERVDGGSDEIENLITLCFSCHGEWTACEPDGVSFYEWLKLPPARILIALLLEPEAWTETTSAKSAREQILASFAETIARRRGERR